MTPGLKPTCTYMYIECIMHESKALCCMNINDFLTSLYYWVNTGLYV